LITIDEKEIGAIKLACEDLLYKIKYYADMFGYEDKYSRDTKQAIQCVLNKINNVEQ